MQLLTFQIGRCLLAVPARSVLSVGREGSEADGTGPASGLVDLSAIIDPGGERAGHRPVIRYRDGARTVELLVDRILALEHCADGVVQPWPGLLRSLPLFTGAAVIGDRVFQVIDFGALKARAKDRRR